MKVMGTEGVSEENISSTPKDTGSNDAAQSAQDAAGAKAEANPMDVDHIASDTMFPGDGRTVPDVKVTAAEKVAFLDAMVANSRLILPYSLFDGRINIKVRSMTFEETRALSEWCIQNAPKDIGGQISGKFRRYLLLAQVEEYNGTKFEPLAKPLFSFVDKDGKVCDPGWVSSAQYWDDKPTVVVSAITRCVADFNRKYEMMTLKAEDVNFWNPDTP